MDRRFFGKAAALSVAATALSGAEGASAAQACTMSYGVVPSSIEQRSVIEYLLPAAQQTHEIVTKPGSSMLLISQMDTSVLLKGRYDGRSEGVTSVHAHPIGNSTSGLHGLWTSTTYPNRVWCTLQNDNALLLLFPGWGNEGAPPKVVKRIDLPSEARGPHNIIEYGDYLWVGLKQTDAVLRINSRNPADYTLFPTPGLPIFIAQHPQNGDYYVSCDQESKIMRIENGTDTTEVIPLPRDKGDTPVGLIAGPTAVWFVMAGLRRGVTGTFGKINADSTISWFGLPGAIPGKANLLHLAFGPRLEGDARPLWLLGRTINGVPGPDAIFKVTFDKDYVTAKLTDYVFLPTQQCSSHRILPVMRSVFATELTTSTLAQHYKPTHKPNWNVTTEVLRLTDPYGDL